MNNYLISVIIPIYNNSKYMRSILNSLLNQTYKNFEIICIDDMSTDNTPDILREYASKDSRLKVYTRTDKGGMPTPNIIMALEHAKGDFFFYMSQDDLIDKDLFEKSIIKINETGADIISNKMVWYYEGNTNNKIIDIPSQHESLILSGREAFEKIIFHEISAFALVKMDIVKTVGYDTLYFDSCDYGNKKQFLNARKIAFVDSKFYYRQDNNTAVTKKINAYKLELIFTAERIYKDLLENNFRSYIVKNYVRHMLNMYKWLLLNFKENTTGISNNDYAILKNNFTKADKILLRCVLKSHPVLIFKYAKLLIRKFMFINSLVKR